MSFVTYIIFTNKNEKYKKIQVLYLDILSNCHVLNTASNCYVLRKWKAERKGNITSLISYKRKSVIINLWLSIEELNLGSNFLSIMIRQIAIINFFLWLLQGGFNCDLLFPSWTIARRNQLRSPLSILDHCKKDSIVIFQSFHPDYKI